MQYVILGMHKSGTTLVAKILHTSGISMAEDLDERVDYDEGNKYERVATALLNHEILRGHIRKPFRTRIGRTCWSVASSKRKDQLYPSLSYVCSVPERLPARLAQRMRDVVARCQSSNAYWGFKDPRTCLTYRLWQPYLQEHRVIVVYRSVAQILRHYNVCGARSFNLPRLHRVLEVWLSYNQNLLEILNEGRVPTLLLRYERLMDDPLEFERLSSFVDRSLSDVREYRKYRNRSAVENEIPASAFLISPFLSANPLFLLERLNSKHAVDRERYLAGLQQP